MKKTLILFLIVVCLFTLLAACVIPKNKVLASLGEYRDHEFYSEGAFQDYTDYAKYYYDSVDFTDNEYFAKIQPSDLDSLHEILDNFERCIASYRENDETCEIVVNYDFDRSWIDFEDYVYIESETWDPWEDGNLVFSKYNVYFFDTQTNTLYYFHNNI